MLVDTIGETDKNECYMAKIRGRRYNLSLFGIAVFLGLIIIPSLFLIISMTKSFVVDKSSAKGINDLPSNLSERLGNYSSATVAEKNELKDLARLRQESLSTKLEENADNPTALAPIIDSISSGTVTSRIKQSDKDELGDDIEKPIKVTGVMSTIHRDFDDGKSDDYVQITDTVTGKSYRVFSTKKSSYEKGTAVKATVSGTSLGADLVVSSKSSDQLSVSSTSVSSVSPTGSKKILAVLIKFSNTSDSELTLSQSDVQSQLFTSGSSVKNYIERSSYGRATFDTSNSQVTNWVTLKYSKPTSSSNCSYTNLINWANDANSKLPSGVVSTNFDHVIYIFPRETNCASSSTGGPWSGWADIKGSRVWVNGLNHIRVYAHELQHNFGLQHATAIDCGGSKPIASYSNCKTAKSASELEYLDVYDNMGSGGKFDSSYNLSSNTALQTNAKYKMNLGWLSSSRQKSVSSSTSKVTLLPLENYSSSGYQVLKIPAPKLNSSDYYYVEYRVPTNVDDAWPINQLNPGGILIRLYGNTSVFHSSSPAVSAIVDAVSPYATAPYTVSKFYDSALRDPGTNNAVFIDTVNNIVIKLTDATSSSATLCIGIGNSSYCN